MKIIGLIILTTCLGLAALAQKVQLPVYDGFDSTRLSKLWDTDKFVEGAVTMQSKVVRKGHSAISIVLNKGDKYEAGNDSSLVSERAELTEARQLTGREDHVYEYTFSMFIPADFPIVPTRLVLAQWKQYCQQEKCSDDSPILALRYTSGVLQITIQIGPHRKVYYETHDDLRNKWTDFKIQADFSRSKGYTKAWINDKQVLDYSGITAYGEERGYPPNSYFYFKMGLYRDTMPQPMTLYIDEYSKRELQ